MLSEEIERYKRRLIREIVDNSTCMELAAFCALCKVKSVHITEQDVQASLVTKAALPWKLSDASRN